MTMMTSTDRQHIISHGATILEALERINALSGGTLTLFVEDESGRVKGTLTDGDIRRFLIGGGGLSQGVAEAMNRRFSFLEAESDGFETVSAARKKGIEMMPRLDKEGRITEIVDLKRLKSLLPIDAVLMAGGKGERLRPLTLDTPKPLLKVCGKPIIDYNVDELMRNGVKNIFVTVNYLKEQLIHHFANVAEVACVEEPKRLGTLGSLSLVEGWRHDVILVMNSDLLTTLSFAEMYLHHRRSGAALTMAVVPYAVSVPFAVLETDGDWVKGLEEKPTYNYFANAGIYMFNRDLLSRIPYGEYLDAPDFIEALIADGLKVGYFPINGMWVDIGSPDDYRAAQRLVR